MLVRWGTHFDNHRWKPWHGPLCWDHRLKASGVTHGMAVIYSIQKVGKIVRSSTAVLNGEWKVKVDIKQVSLLNMTQVKYLAH